MAASNSKVSLKLLIDSKNNKVLFAESGKDFVDFLFNLLALPVATVIRLLTKNNIVGSLGNIYDSIENLDETYIEPNQNKDTLLKPSAPNSAFQLPLLLAADNDSMTTKVFTCPGQNCIHVTDEPSQVCPSCHQKMSIEVPFVAPTAADQWGPTDEGGFVKGVVTYMVMDNLAVKPMSAISSISLLNKFNVEEVGVLQEKGLKLLKSSLESKSVLTDVFLGNMKA
ncbi:hypothetical protein COLO4_14888 [Corchorus olitorius]|uniref:DUF674 domain-containing protein n=1 Tax=Corchorus olitorius TaxID=93759 RepID=A0A1R3JQN1_9ROSI|nr:hypothetical protein COLO4_14888 [Corchorus olitorius]